MLSMRWRGDIKKQALVFFHGFLGTGADFDEVIDDLMSDFFCLTIDMPGHGKSRFTPFIEKEYEEAITSLPLVCPIAIGYSMGGRVIMRLLNEMNLFSSAIFLSAHTGLDEDDKNKQRAIEDLWLERLQKQHIEDFLKSWYAQPLFFSLQQKTSLLQQITKEKTHQDKEGLILCFELMRLSNQKPFTPDQGSYAFLYGEYDIKYKELYLKKSWNVDVVEISESGHAVHRENPKKCAEKIRKIIDKDMKL